MSCVIFGAGKIARGFIGHLLFLSNIEFTFVEKVDTLVDLINERGQYTVNILGDASKNTLVTGAKALKFSQIDEISDAVFHMSETNTGALIVIEQDTKVGDFISGNAVVIDAKISSALIQNIFVNSPDTVLDGPLYGEVSFVQKIEEMYNVIEAHLDTYRELISAGSAN